jgi:hypothetical protein
MMMRGHRLPLWSTRPNLFQLVADLRGIAPFVAQCWEGPVRFRAGVAFYQAVRKVTS